MLAKMAVAALKVVAWTRRAVARRERWAGSRVGELEAQSMVNGLVGYQRRNSAGCEAAAFSAKSRKSGVVPGSVEMG
jgi:hypothetical protein